MAPDGLTELSKTCMVSSSLPYGNTVYHLSATLHAMANPVIEIVKLNINIIKIYFLRSEKNPIPKLLNSE